MTQIFDEHGVIHAVTAVSVGPCVVMGITEKNIRLGYQDIEEKKVKKPQLGMFKKLNITPKRFIREVERSPKDQEVKTGDQIKLDIFQEGDYVDVIGTSIGKGFQGGMKRWNWSGQPQSHGSMMHRMVGSMGANTTPGRVFKGKHLPGHMGNIQSTIQNLKVMRVDLQNNILLISGSFPGNENNIVIIRKALKKKNKQPQVQAKP